MTNKRLNNRSVGIWDDEIPSDESDKSTTTECRYCGKSGLRWEDRFYTRSPYRIQWDIEDCIISNYYITTDLQSVREYEDRVRGTI